MKKSVDICTMKLLLVIVSLTLLIKPVFPVLEYFINYDYIVTELCENKAKPELKCNGKCHLAKELAKAANNDFPNSTDKKIAAQQYETIYFQEIETITFNLHTSKNTLTIPNYYANNYHHLAIDGTFHPPTS